MNLNLAPGGISPLMSVALALAGALLAVTVAWLNWFNRRYPTSEARRRIRRTPPRMAFVLTFVGATTLTLTLAIVATIVDVTTYASSVQQVRAAAADLTGQPISEVQARNLLGNRHDLVVKPIIAEDGGLVGEIRVSGQRLSLHQIGAESYELSTGQ